MNKLHFCTGILRQALLLLAFAGAIFPDARAASQPDWLKEVVAAPAPENKKHADVMLLDYKQVTCLPQGKVHILVRGAIKMLLESGMDRTQISLPTILPYNADTDRVIKARAWIVSADGRHTVSHGKGDFMDSAPLSQYIWTDHRIIRVFPTEDLEVGGIIAWEYEIQAESGIFDSTWYFQSTMPVVKSLFEVIPCPGGTLISHASSPRIPGATTDTASGGLRWEMSHIPGTTAEVPPHFIRESLWVSVRCIAPDSLMGNIKTWADFANLTADIIEPRIPASAAVAEKAASLVKGKTGRWDRIRAITEFVQKEITYLSLNLDKDSLAGYRPHAPNDVMQCRLGDCKDKATLTVSMLRSIGEKAFVVLLFAGDPEYVRQDWPCQAFNHAIVAIAADESVPSHWPQIDGGSCGKLVLFDATNEDTPLGVLPEYDQGGFGLVAAKAGPGLVKFPLDTPENKKITKQIKGTISPEGDLLADMEETMIGSAAGERHTALSKLGNRKFNQYFIDVVFHNAMPLVKDLTWKESWDQTNAQSRLTVHFGAAQYARLLTDDMMLMCPHLLNDHADYPAWKTKIAGIAWLTPQSIHEEVRLHLPVGFMPEELPSAWHQELPNATDSVQYRMEGVDLVYEYNLEQQGGAYNKADYESLRVFYQKLSEAERRSVVLRRLTKTAKSE